MTTTPFYVPTNITQVDVINDITTLKSIPWDHDGAIISKEVYAMTRSPLTTISGFWQEKFYRETSQLWTTGYNIPNDSRTITGIELQMNVQRKARIQDLIIQLTLNGEIIGENRASLISQTQSNMYTAELDIPEVPIEDYHIYGGSIDLWGTELSSADVANSSFGAVISFKSNQVVPHSDIVYLDQVAIRITYA